MSTILSRFILALLHIFSHLNLIYLKKKSIQKLSNFIYIKKHRSVKLDQTIKK